ncbi:MULTISPECIES: AsmA family protein [unclassified Marinovum]
MKWIIRLIGLALLVVGVAVGSLLFLPSDRLARIASDQLSAQLGRRVTIAGDVSMTFYPVLGVSTGPVTIANADWAEETPMFQARAATIALETLPLLQRDIRVKGLYAERPQILLQRQADGRANWQFGAAAATSGGSTGVKRVSIEDLTIKGGSIRIDDAGGTPLDLRNVDIALRWPDPAGAADLELVLRPAGQDVTVTAELTSPLNFMAGGAHPISARISTQGGQATFDGKVSLVPEAQGKLSADLSSTSGFLAALGLGAVDLPQGLGRAIGARTDLTFDADQRLSLRSLTATLDQNRLTGDLDVFLAGKPRVNGKLSAGDLDLSALSDSGKSGGAKSASKGWSTAPIDASALGMLDGEVLIDATAVDLGTMSFGKARVLATLENARAVFSIRELAGYDGSFTGQFVINNRNGLSVGGDLTGRDIAAQALLLDLTGTDRLSGKADAEIKFLASGGSLDALVSSLEGTGAMKFGRGVISGIDLDQLMRSGNGSGGTTIFDSLGASWDIASGRLESDDLALILAALNAEGNGWVNLYEQTIDYVFTPRILAAREGRGLAIPVRIRGPWSRPQISADLAKAVEMNFANEKKQVEAEVRTRVAQELGLEAVEGQSLEGAVKQKVETELLRGLGNLLGGN